MTKRPLIHAQISAAVALVLLLGACQQSETAPTVVQTATTSLSTIPTTALPAPSSASPSMSPDAALVQEATKVLEVSFDLESTLANVGGIMPGEDLPPEFKGVMMGEALKLTANLMYNTHDAKVRRQSGQSMLSSIRPVSETRNGSLVSLEACRDGRAATYSRNGTPFPGILIRHVSFYQRDTDGNLKMFTWYTERVTTCG